MRIANNNQENPTNKSTVELKTVEKYAQFISTSYRSNPIIDGINIFLKACSIILKEMKRYLV